MHVVIARHGADQPVVAERSPRPVGPGQVRVSVAAAAFTYFDAFVAAQSGAMGLPPEVGLGFDLAGTVAEVGPSVDALRVGDRVAGLHVDLTAPVRAHAEEVVMDAADLAVVPAGLALEVAATVPLSALTARQGLDLLGADRGTLLVTGAAGSVGGWALELARRDGWDVTGLVKPGGQEALVPGLPVVTTLAGSYDAVLDGAALHAAAFAAVRDGGRYIGLKPNQPQPPARGVDVRTVQVVPDGAALAALLPLACDPVPVRIAGQGPLGDAAAVYRQAATESGARGRWLLVP